LKPVEIYQGNSPIVLGLPHTGTYIPDAIIADLTLCGRGLDDTDWHIHSLYNGLLAGATTVRATFHRYVIDANRDPSGTSLYPGQNSTGLVPLTNFDGYDIWKTPPDEGDVRTREQMFHAPYHAALQAELKRVRNLHGLAILYDCHSIRSHIPFLFDGTLPDFNIGTNLSTTCAPGIEATTQAVCNTAVGYTSITNGRFKGGWTTRHYGCPDEGLHAIQMELAQSTYLTNEAVPWAFDWNKAARLRLHLKSILTQLAALALSMKGVS
jgi:formiminoglutamase